MIKNEGKGKVWYALHFYPGIAEYREPGQEPLRVLLKEECLRRMDATFAGCPVFVMHVDEVEQDLDQLRSEADGWVTKSFYNPADGKHWVEFITCSEHGDKAIQNGYAVSNAYLPSSYGASGEWNGMDYDKEILAGNFEHLAIVPNPRYVESKILNPEEFKKYNEEKASELKLSNSKSNGEKPMKLSWFERKKVENAPSLESMSVILPKSGKEVTIMDLIKNADEEEVKHEKGESAMAHGEHHVMVDGQKMKVNDLVKKYKDACASLHAMKDSDDDLSEEHWVEEGDGAEDYVEGEGFEERRKNKKRNEEGQEKKDKEALKKMRELEEHEEEELDDEDDEHEEKKDRKKNAAEARERAERLRNANRRINSFEEPAQIFLTQDGLARGKAKYG